ncbi:hypothetical protein I79_024898 [Cricetulus griseus]|uniref:Uncharacterized protein n=1 Tax=Cricetulus griseus TaxID=10029 RepID=G3ILX4_CRIGR|nr:hypothetical protein I79_024898 [Cricetulus griseus]
MDKPRPGKTTFVIMVSPLPAIARRLICIRPAPRASAAPPVSLEDPERLILAVCHRALLGITHSSGLCACQATKSVYRSSCTLGPANYFPFAYKLATTSISILDYSGPLAPVILNRKKGKRIGRTYYQA